MNPQRSEPIEAAAAEWLARQDGVHWTGADERALQAWLSESTAHRVAWLRLREAWRRADQMQALPTPGGVAFADDPQPDTMRDWRGQGRRPMRWSWALAASVVLAAAAVAWQSLRLPTDEERYSTPVGGLEAIALADGSRVTLNTHTRARAIVNDRERQVWLDEGEAYFEVRHDPARSFVVTAGRDRITVLGTKFSVRHEGGRTQVLVQEGRVRLERAGFAATDVVPAQMLAANSDAALAPSGGLMVVTKTAEQIRNHLSWREGRLVFDQRTLGDIAAEFNRYNRRQLVVEGAAADLRLGGSFDAHNVEGFARLAHEGFGLKIELDSERIRLSTN